MNIIQHIEQGVIKGIKTLYGQDITADKITMNATRSEFVGDYTVVVFPFTKMAKKKPTQIGEELGGYLVKNIPSIADYNVIKGFLNLTVSHQFWSDFLEQVAAMEDYGQFPAKGEKVMVEFSSPNTNKPLHLGHIRNILLGWSCSKILEKAGYELLRVQIVNDRGIAICKSMLAWQKFGNEATPQSTGIKSDHFVGNYYVLFEKKFKEEYKAWQKSEKGQALLKEWLGTLVAEKATKTLAAKHIKDQKELDKKIKAGKAAPSKTLVKEDYGIEQYFFKTYKNTYFNEYSTLGQEAKAMLIKWEANDPDTKQLWTMMNNWVYQGFEETYKKLGVSFDQLYYESDTYLLGKDLIEEGLAKALFYTKEDGSVWIDLTDAKLDHKLVLRSDGTSVYMTQDLGTAELRYQDYGTKKMIYTVADEQNYHFKVLFEILKRLERPYANGLHHLSYGMVDLPTGKMKSREGTIVDADDLIAEVIQEAKTNVKERGEVADLSEEEVTTIIQQIGLAALKFFIIKVNPQKRMTFNPKESVDMQGQTGPYIQYSFVRINGITKRGIKEGVDFSLSSAYQDFHPLEKELLLSIYKFPEIIQLAANEYDPSHLANYCYALAKTYSKFWHDIPVFNAKSEVAKAFRLKMSKVIGHILQSGMDMLGIEMPERM